MSFTDIRKFVELMRVLGYPHTISMDSFRTPNFELVADCLHWLILRYDPLVGLDPDISIEGRRVDFLKHATQIMLSGARIKLNSRRLYSADGYAVKELLKVASLLQNATEIAACRENDIDELGPSIKAFDVKATRLLVSEITKCGASLYEILETEPSLQESRSTAIMMDTNMDEIEQGLKNVICTMLESISSTEYDLRNVEKDEEALQAKLAKRKLELERSEKCLLTLHNVRPAYMDKYEGLQKELQELFVVYSEKFRNLQWLQSQMEGHNLEEKEKLEDVDRRMRRLQQRHHEEELCILRGEEVDGSMANVTSSEESDGDGSMFQKWFNGSSFKSILDPHGKVDPQVGGLASATDMVFSKGSMGWMAQGRKAIANLESGSRNQCDINSSLQVDKIMKLTTPNSFHASLDGSDTSVGLDDDELLEMDGIDLKYSGEDDSTDDDF